MRKKAAFYTLGCKVNYCETESLQALLEEAGYLIVAFDEPADLYIINTCTVTGESDHKSRKAIRRARRRNPEAMVVVTGCYAQGAPEEVAGMDEADLVIGNYGRENLSAVLRSPPQDQGKALVRAHPPAVPFEMLPPGRRGNRTRGFIKIQDGCNQSCSYCLVPAVRGPLRSMPSKEVLARVQSIVQSGCREVVLTGIHLGLYGAGAGDEMVTLAALLASLEHVPGLLRLRLSSLEPSDITSELVEQIVRSQVVCPHLHLPLQSGDGEILRLMNRPYEPVEYLYLAKWLKQEIPGLSLSSDLIVGFPGETEHHHRRSMKLVSDIGFSRLHVFKFSPRPETQAAGLPGQLPNTIKERRSREMIALGEEMSLQYRRQFLNTVQPVLIEKVEPHAYGEGFTPHYLRARVKTEFKALHWKGKIIRARIDHVDKDRLEGSRITKRSCLYSG